MKLIQVYSTEGQLEAEMIKGFLEAQGLNVTLSQESIGRTLGLSAGRLGQVKVLVPESQVTSAVELLEAMERGDFEDEDLSDFVDES
jgi:vacuolar-type H+-ATPase subunit B/Vma2